MDEKSSSTKIQAVSDAGQSLKAQGVELDEEMLNDEKRRLASLDKQGLH